MESARDSGGGPEGAASSVEASLVFTLSFMLGAGSTVALFRLHALWMDAIAILGVLLVLLSALSLHRWFISYIAAAWLLSYICCLIHIMHQDNGARAGGAAAALANRAGAAGVARERVRAAERVRIASSTRWWLQLLALVWLISDVAVAVTVTRPTSDISSHTHSRVCGLHRLMACRRLVDNYQGHSHAAPYSHSRHTGYEWVGWCQIQRAHWRRRDHSWGGGVGQDRLLSQGRQAVHSLQSQKRRSRIGGSKLVMLRNTDKPELLIWTSVSVLRDPGTTRLALEAIEVDTELGLVLPETLPRIEQLLLEALPDSPDIRARFRCWSSSDNDCPPAPHPRALSLFRESMIIEPDGFGGSSGFGTTRQDPPREPFAKWTVVLSDTREGLLQARAAGMRCLGISRNWDEDGLESAADTIFDTLGCEGGEDEVVYLDDLYTPGPLWLNPPCPRDASGNWCDPNEGPVESSAGSSSELAGDVPEEPMLQQEEEEDREEEDNDEEDGRSTDGPGSDLESQLTPEELAILRDLN